MKTDTTRPSRDQMQPSEFPAPPLSALEISGAICARVVHDLSNLVSGIMGNAEYARDPEADPASIQKAVQAISVSANSAGRLLGQFLPLQRLVSNEASPCDISELALTIAEASPNAPGWIVLEPQPLTGQVRAHPRWLSAAVWQLAFETAAPGGEIEYECGPAVFPVVWHGSNQNGGQATALFQITLRYRAEEPLFTPNGPVNTERLGLLAVHELIRRFRGQIHARPKPPGRQEISILLPLL